MTISRELLAAVLGYENIKTCTLSTNTLTIFIEGDWDRVINIHELASLTMDWIESEGFLILNPRPAIYELYYMNSECYSINTKDRLLYVFKCGEWTLENRISR